MKIFSSERTKQIIFRTTIFFVFVAGVFMFTQYVAQNEPVQDLVNGFGYWGIFVASIISGFNLFVPIPIITFISLFLESGFNFWPVIYTIALGMTIGDVLGFILGRVGRNLIQHDVSDRYWVSKKLVEIKESHRLLPYLFLFVMVAFVPLPNEITVLPMAFLGYRALVMVPIIFVGNVIFNYLSATGVIAIFNLTM